MRTIAIVNKKGGVGKTTTAVNLAYILATIYGKRVLLVDADGQANASSICFNANEDGLDSVLRGLADTYEGLVDQTDVPGLDLLAAGKHLGDLDMDCITGEESLDLYRLRKFLAVLEEDDVYDMVVVDCPPCISSVACLNGIAAADRIVIPADTTAYSAEGMEDLVKQIDVIRKVIPTISVSGCLVTGVRKSDIDQTAVRLMRENAPIHVFQTVIRRSDDKVRQSSWEGVACCEYSPFCNASRDYRAWAAELMAREGWQ